ncbi:hypothetical protein [uncultured Rubinisphaera sp.]|uniref:hypothetical protein n=1 Tax=uncultured Rubinisphaera sp. TaxID=1678686 RepID=UPI0030D99474|tara:strand:- start:401 stop:571 length:171 start_codon:yes stop_codon:yes gene_type:complete
MNYYHRRLPATISGSVKMLGLASLAHTASLLGPIKNQVAAMPVDALLNEQIVFVEN